MWLLIALLTLSGILDVIHYGSQLAFVAGCSFVLLAVMILLTKKWKRLTNVLSGWKPPIELIALKILSELRAVGIAVSVICAFVGGIAVDHSYNEWKRYNKERSYPIRVFQKLDERLAIVCKTMDCSNCVSDKFKFLTCPNESAPSFDVDKCYKVNFEVDGNSNGECNTFTGDNGNYKEIQ